MRLKLRNKIIVFGSPLEFGEGTATQDLWRAGYQVQPGRFLWLRFLIFTKR